MVRPYLSRSVPCDLMLECFQARNCWSVTPESSTQACQRQGESAAFLRCLVNLESFQGTPTHRPGDGRRAQDYGQRAIAVGRGDPQASGPEGP